MCGCGRSDLPECFLPPEETIKPSTPGSFATALLRDVGEDRLLVCSAENAAPTPLCTRWCGEHGDAAPRAMAVERGLPSLASTI